MRSLRRFLPTLFVLVSASGLGGCASHTHCTDWNGVPGIRGEPAEYQQTTVYALHGLFVFPLIGDGSVEHAIKEFTTEASSRNAKRINIEETDKTYYWYVFPPISFFIHPVVTTVGGQVEGTAGPAVK